MKISIFDIEGKVKNNIELPGQFDEPVRTDIIKRAVEVIQGNNRQAYGARPGAGKRHSALISKRRRQYRGCYGAGISRVPRKIMSRSGTRMNWVGAFAPGTVGGRNAHPPKANKIWSKKINRKERRMAIRSALAATVLKEFVAGRGHQLPNNYPFAVESRIESLEKTKTVKDVLEKLGFSEELKRTEERTIRAGKGKMRGRKYKSKKGVLIVVGENCRLMTTAKNLHGIEVAEIKNINVELLAPGAQAGRLTLFTDGALAKLNKEKLFS